MPRADRLCRGLLLTLLLVACSASKDSTIPPGGPSGGVAVPLASKTIYVANYYESNVVVFPMGRKSPSRTITDGVSYPNSLTVDNNDSLYVGNYGAATGSFNSSVSVYSSGSSRPGRTIVTGIFGPFAMTTVLKKLYVANNGGDTIAIFVHGATKPLRTIFDGVRGPEALGFDSKGNLYVADWVTNEVTVYPPNKSSPSSHIKTGIFGPSSLALDAADNLYVANQRANSITVYKPGKKNNPKKITDGIARPIVVLLASNEIYVLNYDHNTVTAYDENTLARVATTSAGVACPSTMTADAAGYLYVANTCPAGISIFTPGLTLQSSLSKGVSSPVAIVVR